MGKFVIYHTKSYKKLANSVLVQTPAHSLWELGKLETSEFPDGESYHRLTESDIKNKDIVVIGGTVDDRETMELFDICCSVVKLEAKTLTIVIPYYGYSTMERAVKSGEIVKAKTRARLLSSIPSAGTPNRIFFIDLHADGIQYYFEGNIKTHHIYAKPVITEACREIMDAGSHNRKDFVLGSTDAGRAKWIESLASDMGVDCAIIIKRRTSGSETEVTGINADVKGKTVIIYDDMIRTGGSLLKAAKAYKEAGAGEIHVISTHGVLPGKSLDKLMDARHGKASLIQSLYLTDTHPRLKSIPAKYKGRVIIKSVASLIVSNL